MGTSNIRLLSRIRNEKKEFLIAIIPAVLVIVFNILPLTLIGSMSISGFTLDNYLYIIHDATYKNIYIQSFVNGLIATFGCILIAYPITYWLAHHCPSSYRFPLLAVITLPMWMNYVVLNYSWANILARGGFLNYILQPTDLQLSLLYTRLGVEIVLTYVYLPYAVLTLYISMERLDYKLVEAARELGANNFRIFIDIIIPQTIFGVIAAVIIMFARMAGAYVTPVVIGGPGNQMVAQLIENAFRTYLDWPFAATLSFVFFITILFIYTVSLFSKKMRVEYKQW